MFTVSCYAFHPLVLRFVRIWRYTQMVSEVLTCILSMLCCQCMNMMLLSNRSSNESEISVQRFKDDFLPHTNIGMIEEGVDPRAQQTLVNIQPEKATTPQPRPPPDMTCGDGLQLVKIDPEVQDTINYPVQTHICSSRGIVKTSSFSTNLGNSIPAIHTAKKGIIKPSSSLYIK